MNQLAVYLGYAQLLAQLIDQGKTSVDHFRGFLKQEGATPEQFADLDARLTAAINRRETERGNPT